MTINLLTSLTLIRYIPVQVIMKTTNERYMAKLNDIYGVIPNIIWIIIGLT